MEELSVDEAYIDILTGLYKAQSAKVHGGIDSIQVCIERGVKQGDPLSPLLFLYVMEVIFPRKLKVRWNNFTSRRTGNYYVIVVDRPEVPLVSLQSADDVLLIASWKSQH